MLGESCQGAPSKAGQACATSADCCGLACTPNPRYQGDAAQAAFVCGSVCAVQGESCTTGADCCPGLPCSMPPGSARGTCGSLTSAGDSGAGGAGPGATTSEGDANVADGPSPSGSGGATGSGGGGSVMGNDANAGTSTTCAEWGQVCSTAADCCAGVPCTAGRCLIVQIQ